VERMISAIRLVWGIPLERIAKANEAEQIVGAGRGRSSLLSLAQLKIRFTYFNGDAEKREARSNMKAGGSRHRANRGSLKA